MLCEMAMTDSIDHEFDFGEDEQEIIARSKIYGARTTASVKIDPNTGKIGGWDSLFELLDMDNEYLAINLEDADEQAQSLLKKIRPGDYKLTQVDEKKFVIEHRDGTKFYVNMKID